MHALVRNFPMREVEKLAVFNAVGLVDDAAGFAGKGRVWVRVRHAPTVCLCGIAIEPVFEAEFFSQWQIPLIS